MLEWLKPFNRFFVPEGRKVKVSPVLPVKDWQSLAERLEKRVFRLEADAQLLAGQYKEKDKLAQEHAAVLAGLKQQLDQHNSWRTQEDAGAAKEKIRERAVQEDLHQTRIALNSELTSRIRQDAELKDLRRIKEELSTEGRRLTSQVADLKRQFDIASKELNHLRGEHSLLKKKSEGTEWVSKADYKQLEVQLKKARQEVTERN